jgi:hypothetical protein
MNKIKIEIHQKGDKLHQDSFWYHGHIATLSYKDKDGDIRNIYIYAVGDIRIHKKGGELVHDGFKERGDGIKLENDNDLKKIGSSYDDDYYWENNNWFSFEYDLNDGQRHDFLGDWCYEYDIAIAQAKENLLDEEFWQQFKVRNK